MNSRSACSLRRRTTGFTLLEALVALTIMGMTLVPLLGWFAQQARILSTGQSIYRRAVIQASSLEVMKTVNPVKEPQGSARIGDLDISWTSQVLVPPALNSRQGAGLASWVLGFYRVDVVAQQKGDEPLRYSLRKVGYQRLDDRL